MSNRNKVLKGLKERFAQCTENTFVYPKHKLFEELWLTDSKSDLLQQAKDLNVPENILMFFYKITNYNIVSRFEDALAYWDCLEHINGSGGYTVNTFHYVCVKEGDNLIHRCATDDELLSLLRCENIIFKKMNISNGYHTVIKDRLWNDFNKYLKEELNKINPNIEYYYESYSISFIKD